MSIIKSGSESSALQVSPAEAQPGQAADTSPPWTLHGISQTSTENPVQRKEVCSVPHLQCRQNVPSHLPAELESSDTHFPLERPLHFVSRGQQLQHLNPDFQLYKFPAASNLHYQLGIYNSYLLLIFGAPSRTPSSQSLPQITPCTVANADLYAQ